MARQDATWNIDTNDWPWAATSCSQHYWRAVLGIAWLEWSNFRCQITAFSPAARRLGEKIGQYLTSSPLCYR